jgi:hypothetical protein
MPRRPNPTATETNTAEDKIILSIDIGTTQSAVAVYYNKPSEAFGWYSTKQTDRRRPGVLHEPLVTHVSRWPGQEATMYEEKVPSALLYDEQDNVGFPSASGVRGDE